MAESLGPHRRGQPCEVCGSRDCKRFPDSIHDPFNPFLGATASDLEAEPIRPPRRPKGKRRPAEDRMRRLEEDR